MRTTIPQLVVLLFIAVPSYADIANCTLGQYELHDPVAMAVKVETIRSAEGKDSPVSVVIAGLDSPKITAKGGFYAISAEEQIYPMPQGWGLSGKESEWYYVKYDSGMAVFELSAKTRRRDTLRAIVIHDKNSPLIPDYTMVGHCK